jgi:uncharacterized tellurite resistance protein B-like protein
VLNTLNRFINRYLQPSADSGVSTLTEHQKQVAMAALLVEVAIADQDFSTLELDQLSLSLQQKLKLSSEECRELIATAKAASGDATSLYEFTQLINQYCSPIEKRNLIKEMWEVAYADGSLDKYEDHLIRKVADLIYVPHSDFIRTKNQVKKEVD